MAGPLMRLCYRGTLLVLLPALASATVLLLVQSSPANGLAGGSRSPLLTVATLLSPYCGMLVAAFLLASSGVWRGIVMLLGSLVSSGYGLTQLFALTFLAGRPIQAGTLDRVVITHWALVGAALALAMVPGILIGRVLDRWAASRQRAETADPSGESG